MADNNLPLLTVTGPNGEQQAVPVFGFPAREEELIPLEQWLRPCVDTPAPGATTNLASAAASGPASLPITPPFDVDTASFDKMWKHVCDLQEAAAMEGTQALDDIAYSRLPDTLAEYKRKRVAASDYIPCQCRIYEKEFRSGDALRAHLGYSKMRGKHTVWCKDAKRLIAEREEQDEDEQPQKKKQKKQKSSQRPKESVCLLCRVYASNASSSSIVSGCSTREGNFSISSSEPRPDVIRQGSCRFCWEYYRRPCVWTPPKFTTARDEAAGSHRNLVLPTGFEGLAIVNPYDGPPIEIRAPMSLEMYHGTKEEAGEADLDELELDGLDEDD